MAAMMGTHFVPFSIFILFTYIFNPAICATPDEIKEVTYTDGDSVITSYVYPNSGKDEEEEVDEENHEAVTDLGGLPTLGGGGGGGGGGGPMTAAGGVTNAQGFRLPESTPKPMTYKRKNAGGARERRPSRRRYGQGYRNRNRPVVPPRMREFDPKTDEEMDDVGSFGGPGAGGGIFDGLPLPNRPPVTERPRLEMVGKPGSSSHVVYEPSGGSRRYPWNRRPQVGRERKPVGSIYDRRPSVGRGSRPWTGGRPRVNTERTPDRSIYKPRPRPRPQRRPWGGRPQVGDDDRKPGASSITSKPRPSAGGQRRPWARRPNVGSGIEKPVGSSRRRPLSAQRPRTADDARMMNERHERKPYTPVATRPDVPPVPAERGVRPQVENKRNQRPVLVIQPIFVFRRYFIVRADKLPMHDQDEQRTGAEFEMMLPHKAFRIYDQ